MDRSRIPGLQPGQRHPNWETLYERAAETSLPWHSATLDPDLSAELARLPFPQKILEVGCGLGNQAFFMSELGHEVVATDISAAAIDRARSSYPGVRFLIDDVTETRLHEQFDVVVDRGCFHVLDPERYTAYLFSLSQLLKPRGHLLLKVLSVEQGRQDFGPHCFTMLGLHRIFGDTLEIVRIQRAQYQGSTKTPPRAWWSVMRRKTHHG